MAIREISTILTAKDEASDSLAAVSATGDDTADSMADVESETEAASEGLLDLDARASAAAASVAGLGTAMQSTLDSTRNTREELARASVTLGKTRRETEALAASLSDATFPVEDASATISTLAQTGVEGEEQMRETALAVDLLGDATGTTANEAAQLAPVVQALDGDLSALTDETDAFTAAANETNLELRDVISTIERLDFQELEEMGVTSSEAAGLVALFGQETGYTGRRLRSEFRQAVEETDGDVDDLADNLGLTTEQVEEFNEEIGDGTDLTEEYAEANNSAVTSMDRLRAVADRAQLRVAGLSEGASVAAPALQAAGGAALFWANINTATLIPSLKAKSAWLVASAKAALGSVKASLAAASAKGVLAGAGFTAAGAITTLWAATGPLGLAALALTGIILGLVGVMRTDLFGAGEQAEAILGRLRGGVETTVAVIRELLGIGKELGRIGLTAGALGLIAPFAAVLAFFDDPGRFADKARAIPGAIVSGVTGQMDAAGDEIQLAAAELPGRVVDGLDALGPAQYALPIIGPMLAIGDGIKRFGPQLKSAAMNLPSKITEGLAALGPAKYALPILGPLLLAKDAITDPSKWISAGKQIPSMIANGIKATATDPVGAVTSMVGDVRDRLPFSPAAAGPLTDLGETGPGLVSTIATGIEDEAPQLTSVVESMFAATPLGIAFNAGQSLAEGQQSSQPAQGSQPSGDAISVDITIEEINAGDGSTDAVRQAAESGLQDPVDKLIRQLSREIPQ